MATRYSEDAHDDSKEPAPFTLKEPPAGKRTQGADANHNIDLSMSMHQPGAPFGEPEVSKTQKWWLFFCGTPCRAMLGCLVLTLIAIISIVPIVLLVITPIIVNMFVNATTMTIVNASLAETKADTIVVQSFIELNNAGPLPATLYGFNATLEDAAGRMIGWLVFPDFKLDANSANLQETTSLLTITNPTAIYEEGLEMMAGRSVSWRVKGDTTIVALGIGFKVTIDKPLTFPGVYLDSFVVRDHATPAISTVFFR